jgi:glycosyltransferase involved in cell wall biosynthesis
MRRAVSELISVIVSTYERPDALDAVLRSLSRQSDRGFEVVIADDGSGPDTAAVIERWRPRLGAPLLHVRHDQRNFRAAEIRNRAVLASRGSYCVFLDGDCLARGDFIAAHRQLSEPRHFVAGNRVLMSPAMTEAALRQHLEPEAWSLARWIVPYGRRAINRLMPLIRLPLGPLRKLSPRAWRGARSCNLAVWRSDLDRVDGFDADYQGWGREDSDLLVRLIRAGVRRKDGRFATGVLHLWHPDNDRSRLPANDQKLDGALRGSGVRAARGLSALGPTSPT